MKTPIDSTVFTSDIERMAVRIKALWHESNGNEDTFTDREWQVACMRWWNLVHDEILEDIEEYVFGSGYRIHKTIEPKHLCDHCDNPALKDDIFCLRHRKEEDALWAEQPELTEA